MRAVGWLLGWPRRHLARRTRHQRIKLIVSRWQPPTHLPAALVPLDSDVSLDSAVQLPLWGEGQCRWVALTLVEALWSRTT